MPLPLPFPSPSPLPPLPGVSRDAVLKLRHVSRAADLRAANTGATEAGDGGEGSMAEINDAHLFCELSRDASKVCL